MKTKETEKIVCPVRYVLDGIGGKWSILIIDILGEKGTLRFNEISKTLGDISQKMLTSTLRLLESDGIISRKMFAEIPPRVEYELTELGKDLLPHIRNLIDWAKKNMQKIEENRKLNNW
ncbi:MAG TPA: transcriptional regulator [Porphyromonadaceae bacterium]|nr:transcriptional regulator [Porphyromonadaceae bacterium]